MSEPVQMAEIETSADGFVGARMDADAFSQIQDEWHKYELVDGVVILSPSPSPRHQSVAGEIYNQLYSFVRRRRAGLILYETDVHLRAVGRGRDLVYRPEIVYFRPAREPDLDRPIAIVPDLVVEVISAESRRLDSQTKLEDYERFGVREYWLFDPENCMMRFFVLVRGRYVEARAVGPRFASKVVPGFKLDRRRIRSLMSKRRRIRDGNAE